MMVRLVNDAMHDPYFRLSKIKRVERRKYAKDLLQPGDEGFDLLYPQHKKQQLEAEDKQERESWKSKNEHRR